MRRLRIPGITVALSVAALAATGCGGSSSSSSSSASSSQPAATTAATTSSASTPASASTPGTSSTRGAINPNAVPKSAAIGSGAYFNALVQAFSRRLPSSQAQFAAHCIQSGLQGAGFKTQGEAEGRNTNKALSIVIPCLQQARSH